MKAKMKETGQVLPKATRSAVVFPQATSGCQKRWRWPAAFLAMIACVAGARSLHAQTQFPWFWVHGDPSDPSRGTKCGQPYVLVPNLFRSIVGCFNVTTGNWDNCEVVATEYFSLDAVKGTDQELVWNGGHEHDRNAGDFDRTIGLLYCEVDQGGGSDPSKFEGLTNFQAWWAVKAMPEASGVIRMTTKYKLTNPRAYWIVNNIWRLDPSDPTGNTVSG